MASMFFARVARGGMYVCANKEFRCSIQPTIMLSNVQLHSVIYSFLHRKRYRLRLPQRFRLTRNLTIRRDNPLFSKEEHEITYKISTQAEDIQRISLLPASLSPLGLRYLVSRSLRTTVIAMTKLQTLYVLYL